MRKALVIGVDHYERISPLGGCVNDANAVKAMLDRHADGSKNFHTKIRTSGSAGDALDRRELRGLAEELFSCKDDIQLLYYAGHGHVESTGGYICASDSASGNDGLALSDIVLFAARSEATNKIIILDSCFSGAAGNNALNPKLADLAEGMTILTASTKDQYALEKNGGGLFTGLLIDALGGAAANLMGDVTPGSVYAHIDQSLAGWSPRPVFKTNVMGFVSLRQVTPPIDAAILRRLPEFFPVAGFELPLDPAYEPELPSPGPNPGADARKTAIFLMLQKMNRVGLLKPVNAPHMYNAAIESDSVRLTALGEHYRRLAEESVI